MSYNQRNSLYVEGKEKSEEESKKFLIKLIVLGEDTDIGSILNIVKDTKI